MITNPILPQSGNTGVSFFQKAIPAAVTLALVAGVLIFFFMLVLGAIQWISSGGDKQALETAKGKVSNALIGLVILFAVFIIIRLIDTFFGLHILEGLAIPTVGS